MEAKVLMGFKPETVRLEGLKEGDYGFSGRCSFCNYDIEVVGYPNNEFHGKCAGCNQALGFKIGD